ncbi:MAG: hypothetical protein NT142_18550 [Planctomycetota bacterium]|nr:hypothetical protein [Planctomycetota bacterium]
MKRRIAFALLGMLLIVALGCFDPRGRVTFQAKVIIDDKPIGDVCVYLSPKDGSGPAPISGITDESGMVSLAAAPGEYHVCFEKGEKGPTMIMDPGAAKKMGLEFKAGGVSPDAPKAGEKKAKGGPPKGMEMKKTKGGGPKMGDAGAPPAPAKDAKMNGIFLSFKDPNTTPFSVTVPTPGIVEFNLSKSEP